MDASEPPVKVTFVSTPREATVFLLNDEGNEHQLCETSCLHAVRRDARSVKVVFRRSGYADEQIEFIPNRDRIVEVTLSKRRGVGKNGSNDPHRPSPRDTTKVAAKGVGYLSVRAIPQSDVFLDGRRLGRSPIVRREVPAGRHKLRLVPRREVLGPGVTRTPKTLVITIASGQTKNVVEYW